MKKNAKSILFVLLVSVFLGASLFVGCKNPFMPEAENNVTQEKPDDTKKPTPPVGGDEGAESIPEQKVDAKEPSITAQPMNQIVSTGVNFSVQVSAESLDGGTLSYQWYQSKDNSYNGTVIQNAKDAIYTSSYTLASGEDEKILYYYVVITNTLESATGEKTKSIKSDIVIVTIDKKKNAQVPVLTEQPKSYSGQSIDSYVLNVVANVTDGGSLTYQWYSADSDTSEGVEITDANLNSYSIPKSNLKDAKYYYCKVTNTITDNGDGGVKVQEIKSAVVLIDIWEGIGYIHPSSKTQENFAPIDNNGSGLGYGWNALDSELGAVVNGNETTFAVYSKNASKILLEIYDVAYGEDAKYDYWMEKGNDNIWRAKIRGAGKGTLYAFRAWGPTWTFDESWDRGNSSVGFVQDYDSTGNRFNPNKVLFDPYAKEISHDKSNPAALGSYDGGMYGTGSELYNGEKRRDFDTGKYAPKSVVVDDSTSYGTKPKIPQEKAIIYEAHARGITKHPSSASLKSILNGIDGFENVVNIPAEYQGTYKGAGMLAPYLKALGVNTIELLPVHESDNDANPDDAPGGNYWAYMTYGYFAPDRRYSSDKSYGGPTKEFKEMVAAFHEAGMEVYLDVVFNHSGEGGPWYGTKDSYNTAELTFMRGLDCSEYYCLTPGNVGDHWQTTGCGNNLRCDNPIVRKLILDSLEYWIAEMGVDGYRFDLAPVIGREFEDNKSGWLYNKNATTIKDIMSLGTKYDAEMIAEAWDCHGSDGYHVGNFPTGWGEWNGRFRDSLRGFVNVGNRGSVNDYINGDYNNFNDQGGPHKTVNFVVAHDGFTLADLCSYGGAGNAQNGELTWPFGPSDGGNGDNNSLGFVDWTSEATQKASKRQANRNYTAIQMMSRGVPMIVWGDEFTRTQNGNNNPYNIDSVATWSNYNMINTDSPHKVATGGDGEYHNNFGTFNNTEDVNGNFMFMNYMLKLKASEPALNQPNYNVGYDFKKEDGKSTLVDGDRCVWLHIDGSSVSGGSDYLIFMNMYTSEVSYTIPTAATGKKWVRLVDTQSYFETDFNCWDEKSATTVSSSYGVTPWSVVILKEVENVVVPTVATPSISGSSYFDSSTTVTITCGTNGATIYYTTDGTIPSVTKGTEYTAPFTISSTTTVKAKAFKTNYQDSSVASKTFTKGVAPVGSSKSGVMLQGFNWGSAPRTASSHWGKWYNVMLNNADTIGDKFSYVWCPPPSKCDTASSEGYCPTELNVLDNCYGTANELKQMIQAISPAKAIADIVVNHRSGSTSWGDFTNPDWGVVKGSKYGAICSNDEGFTKEPDLMGQATVKGASDTGEGYEASRDIDHTNTTVQQGIVDWMNNVLKPAGFVGWRYDYVKGFAGKYVGQYNAGSDAEFSVGEYWPTAGYNASSPSDWGNQIKNWISATASNGGQKSKAFDFALKGAMNSIFGCTWFDANWNGGSSGASNNYGLLADSSNLVISQPADAVTFVENHDTGSTQNHWALNTNAVGIAYAFILTHPGYPCVAWQHYFTYAESGSYDSEYYSKIKASTTYIANNTVPGTSNTYREHIDYLIDLRNRVGIEYDDTVVTTGTTSSCYVGEIVGNNGTLLVKIGNVTAATGTGYAGNNPIYAGTNFAIWEKDVDGDASLPSGGNSGGGNVSTGDVTLTLTGPDWTWTATSIFCWAWNDSSEGAWYSCTGSGTTVKATVPKDATGFLIVRCYQGTTVPDWSISGDVVGRIYNKTSDIEIQSGVTNYNISFIDYAPY